MQKRVRYSTLFFVCFFISIVGSSTIPNVQAQQSIQDKGVSILTNVAGLDMTSYAVSSKVTSENTEKTYLGVLPEENVFYDLKSSNSNLSAICTFVDGSLETLHVFGDTGSPSINKAVSSDKTVEYAQSFLSKYQTVSTKSIFGELRASLDNVPEGRNLTKTVGNTVLNVSSVNGSTTFKWYYTENGVIAPYTKTIALSVKNGFVEAFVDYWQLHNVGSSSVKITKEEAISIAIDAAKDYSKSINLTSQGFKEENINSTSIRWSSLLFDMSLNADTTRSEDLLELYPVWSIGVALDKWYGQLYGIQVDVWADNGQVRVVEEAWSSMSPEEPFLTQNVTAKMDSFGLSAVFLSFLGLAFIVFFIKSGKFRTYTHKIITTKKMLSLLCLGFILLLVSSSFGAVFAETYEPVSVVWGSSSSGAYDPNFDPPNYNWRKSLAEKGYQQSLASNISWTDFDAAGYSAYNHLYSVKSSMLSDLTTFKNAHAPLIVVDFDHGVGRSDYSLAPGEFHYLIEDNVGNIVGPSTSPTPVPGNGVYDMDIYPLVDDNQVIFAFINTCYSANLTHAETGAPWQGDGVYGARTMPYAFMHHHIGTDMSSDGYYSPDGTNQVYIGFLSGSAAFDQTVPFGQGSNLKYYLWVQDFFYYATHNDMSINNALDEASWRRWQCDFGDSALRTGFLSYWYNGDYIDRDDRTMAVYGDGNMHLQLRTLTVNAYDTNSNPVTADVIIDGYNRGTTGNSFMVGSGTHTIQVGSSANIFHYFTGHAEFTNTITASVTSATTITANYYANPPPQYTLSVSATAGGTTSPYTPGNHQCTPGLVTVTANPNNGYIFKQWVLDAQPIYQPYGEPGRETITVPMSANHNLQAVFVPEPEYKWISSVTGYSGPVPSVVTDPSYVSGPFNDGYAATLQGLGPYQCYGWITCSLNAQAIGRVYAYGNGNGPLYVYTSTDGSNWTPLSAVQAPGSPGWIDCGVCATPFSYIRLTAEYPNDIYSVNIDSVKVDSTQYTLTVSSNGNGYTVPSGSAQHYIGTTVNVQAYPNAGYLLDHWLLDGNNAGNNPSINVYMGSSHTLQAVFAPTPVTYVSSVTDCGGAVANPSYIIGQPDGQSTVITCIGGWSIFGYVTCALSTSLSGDVFVYGSGNGDVGVFGSADGSNWSLIGGAYLPSSPEWVYCGQTDTISYIRVLTGNPTGIFDAYVDSVKVQQ